MKLSLSAIERRVLGAIQHGLPLSRQPYQEVSASIGLSEEQLFEVLGRWKAEKKIRRVGAIVNHFQMGHGAGAMVVWRVSDDEADRIGALFAAVGKVSHAYRRPCRPQWPYTLYTMVHAASDQELEETVRRMSLESGIQDYRLLKTVRELKKVPPTYIVK